MMNDVPNLEGFDFRLSKGEFRDWHTVCFWHRTKAVLINKKMLVASPFETVNKRVPLDLQPAFLKQKEKKG